MGIQSTGRRRKTEAEFMESDEDIKLIQTSERCLYGFPQRKDETNRSEGPLSSRKILGITGTG